VHHGFRRATALCSLFALASSTACYSYLPSPMSTTPAEQPIRVYLTTAGGAHLSRTVGSEPANPESVDGLVTAHTDSSVTLSVQGVTRLGHDREQWKGESVEVPLTSIDHTAVRQVNRGQSIALALAVAAGLLLARSLSTGSDDSVSGAHPGGTGSGQ
jgi:hypothetical protein